MSSQILSINNKNFIFNPFPIIVKGAAVGDVVSILSINNTNFIFAPFPIIVKGAAVRDAVSNFQT